MTPRSERLLHRTLWRYRAGWLPESRLTAAVEERLQALTERVTELEGRADLLRELPENPWRAQDEARSAAVRALGWREFEACVGLLDTAARHLDLLSTTVSVEAALSSADRAWERFVGSLRLDELADCPTLRIPGRLGRLARELLRLGQPRAAARVGAIRQALCTALRSEDAAALGPRLLAERLDSIGARSPQQARHIEELNERGFGTLASRLADDVDARLVPLLRSTEAPPEVEDLSARAGDIHRLIVNACRSLEE